MGRPIKLCVLSAADRAELEHFTRGGHRPVRAVQRGRTLLALAQGQSQQQVANTLGLCRQTVGQVRRRYQQTGLSTALAEAPRSGGPPRFDGAPRAALTALACTPAPVGHSRWTLRLLADKAVELCLVEAISHETVGQVLKKTSCGPTASSTGAWAQ